MLNKKYAKQGALVGGILGATTGRLKSRAGSASVAGIGTLKSSWNWHIKKKVKIIQET